MIVDSSFDEEQVFLAQRPLYSYTDVLKQTCTNGGRIKEIVQLLILRTSTYIKIINAEGFA